MLTMDLPLPPSANALFKNNHQGGRSKTVAYRSWLDRAGYVVRMAHRAAGRPVLAAPLVLHVHLGLPDRRRDAGNCLKPIEDLLVQSIDGLPDDRYNDTILIRRAADIPVGVARVMIASLSDGIDVEGALGAPTAANTS